MLEVKTLAYLLNPGDHSSPHLLSLVLLCLTPACPAVLTLQDERTIMSCRVNLPPQLVRTWKYPWRVEFIKNCLVFPAFHTPAFEGSGSHWVHVLHGLILQINYKRHKYFLIVQWKKMTSSLGFSRELEIYLFFLLTLIKTVHFYLWSVLFLMSNTAQLTGQGAAKYISLGMPRNRHRDY